MDKKPEGRSEMTSAVYQIALALSGLLVAGGLWGIGTPNVWWVPAAISIFASVTKLPWVLKVVPGAVVGSIAFGLLRFYDDSTQIGAGFVFLGAFVAIVSSQTLDRTMRPFGGAPGMTGLFRSQKFVTPSKSVPVGHLLSGIFFVFAWWLAGYLMSDFTHATSNPEAFREFRNYLKSTVRLVPWAYCGIKLVFLLAFFFAVVHGGLSYLECSLGSPLRTAMRLRNELWIWSRREQLMVGRAKARRKH